jgi:hypothetical protein
MFNFTDIVSDILLEQEPVAGGNDATTLDKNTADIIIAAVNSKLQATPINEAVLEKIYRFYQGTYFTGELLISSDLFDYVPVLDIVSQSLGGTKPKATTTAKNENINTFYQPLANNINTYTKDLMPIYAGYSIKDNEMQRIYTIALKVKGKNVLSENVWPTISQLTITNALDKILQTRLTKLEQLKISVQMLNNVTNKRVKTITDFKTYTDALAKDIFLNTDAYSSGAKKINPEVANILLKINITYEDLLKLATYTKKLYESLLYAQFPEPEQNTPEQRALDASLNKVKDNTLLLAKYGSFNYTLPITQISIRPEEKQDVGYNLDKIDKINNEASKEIVDIFKRISTGSREKDQQFQKLISQRLSYLSQAADALLSISGQKLMP